MTSNAGAVGLQKRVLTLGFDASAFHLESGGECFRSDGAVRFEFQLEARVASFEVGLEAFHGGLAELDGFEELFGVLEVDLVVFLGTGTGAGDVVADLVRDLLVEFALCGGVHVQGEELAVDPLGVDRLEDRFALLVSAFDVTLRAELDEFGTRLGTDLAENRVGDVIVDGFVQDGTSASVLLIEFFDRFGHEDGELDFADFGQLLFHTYVFCSLWFQGKFCYDRQDVPGAFLFPLALL